MSIFANLKSSKVNLKQLNLSRSDLILEGNKLGVCGCKLIVSADLLLLQ